MLYKCTILTQKNMLPTHIILGASDFEKNKNGNMFHVGGAGEPFAEQTKMGWAIMSAGRKSDILSTLFIVY